MGCGKKRAERSVAYGQQAEDMRLQLQQAREAVHMSSDALWSMVVSGLKQETKEYCESLPAAQMSGLCAEHLSNNNVTIRTKMIPLLQFEVVFHPSLGIDGEISERYSSFENPRIGQLEMIRFAVDPQGQPWFTDGERYLHPSQVVEELIDRVAQFFDTLAARPKVVR